MLNQFFKNRLSSLTVLWIYYICCMYSFFSDCSSCVLLLLHPLCFHLCAWMYLPATIRGTALKVQEEIVHSPDGQLGTLVTKGGRTLRDLANWVAHIGRSTRNSNPVMTSSAGGAKGCSDHRFRAPPAYTAQLLTLYQHRANNQYRTLANQI